MIKCRAVSTIAVLAVCLFWSATAATGDEPACPLRENWQENSRDCPCRAGWKPSETQLRDLRDAHAAWRQAGGLHDPSLPGRLQLCAADLREIDLSGADLTGANLEEADLRFARLENAELTGADMRGADLRAAKLPRARLMLANLENADLGGATLDGAILDGTIVTNANLAFASVYGALYSPASPPPSSYVERIEGLSTVVLWPGKHSGLVQLRELLRQAGLRDLEREATFAIEHNKASDLRRLGKPFEQLGGWLKLVFFEWTTAWGMHPERALLILLALMVGFTPVYTLAILTLPLDIYGSYGIYRVWPSKRLDELPEAAGVSGTPPAERLTAGIPAAIAWAFYFSMLSAFHIGWRDLNVGSWLTRLQPNEFALRAKGWVRSASGLQSLISVYLVAMWVLTYFGRPFQ